MSSMKSLLGRFRSKNNEIRHLTALDLKSPFEQHQTPREDLTVMWGLFHYYHERQRTTEKRKGRRKEMTRFISWIKERLHNHEGITTIEIAISAMIILVGLAGFVDMVNMSQKLDTASSVNGYVGRVVANQGGVRAAPTAQHDGNYVSSTQLYREVQTTLANGGIAEKDFVLKVSGKAVKPGTNIPLQEFGTRIPIELTINYEWTLMGNLLPGNIQSKKTSNRVVVSSFKVRKDSISTTFN